MTDLTDARLDPVTHRGLSDVLLEIRRRFPDLRFGQLVCNLAFAAESDAWDVEDVALRAAAERFLDRHRDRPESVPPPVSGTA